MTRFAHAELLVRHRQRPVRKVSVERETVRNHVIPAALPGTEEDDVEVEEEVAAELGEVLGGKEVDRGITRLVEINDEEKNCGGGSAQSVVEYVGLQGGCVSVGRG